MAFNTITIGSNVFVATRDGEYVLNTLTYGQPMNILKITPGSVTAKSKTVSLGISRHLEADFTVGSTTERRKLTVNLQVVVPEGFNATQVDTLIADLSTFLDATSLNRIMMGEK